MSTGAFPKFYSHNGKYKGWKFYAFLFLSQGAHACFSNSFSVGLKYLKLHICNYLGQVGDSRIRVIPIFAI